MDVSASMRTSALWVSFFGISLSTLAFSKVAFASFLGLPLQSSSWNCLSLWWTWVSPFTRLPCERAFLEVLFRRRRVKKVAFPSFLGLQLPSSSWPCLSLWWTWVPPCVRLPCEWAFSEFLFLRWRSQRWRSRLSLACRCNLLPEIVFPCDGRECLHSPACLAKGLFWRSSFDAGVLKRWHSRLSLAWSYASSSWMFFLAMDASASVFTPALWQSFFGSSLSTKALSKVAFASFLGWTFRLWRLAPSCDRRVCSFVSRAFKESF